jgi:predicted 2-oxoglutarate/Fe(II)-dependent dioxygenase YbiX
LIALYEAKGGTETGTISKTSVDPAVKRRKDCDIVDQDTLRRIQIRIRQRVAPEIERLFFMKITRVERYIVGCYTAEDGGHFRPHRDNTSTKSAHRRFAISINLNDDFSGGEVRFPEYSARGHKARAGWAIVFPCAILHMVTKVTSGRRYAFLPFAYDEQGAQVRAANREGQVLLA